jgi:hypothetical protein
LQLVDIQHIDFYENPDCSNIAVLKPKRVTMRRTRKKSKSLTKYKLKPAVTHGVYSYILTSILECGSCPITECKHTGKKRRSRLRICPIEDERRSLVTDILSLSWLDAEKDKLLVERFSKLDVVLYLIERAYRDGGNDHQLPVFQKMYNTTLRTWVRMADSLGLSPMARQQLGIKSDEHFVSLREYLEVKEEEPDSGDSQESDNRSKQ